MTFLNFQRRLTSAILVGIAALLLLVPGALSQDSDSRKVRNKVAPTYPELARKMNVTGTVKIALVIAPNGSVRTTKVIGGHPLLVGAAEEALKKWKYEPATSDTTTVVEFHFTGA